MFSIVRATISSLAFVMLACDIAVAAGDEPRAPAELSETIEMLFRDGAKFKRELDKLVDRALPKSLLDGEDLESIAKATTDMNGVVPSGLSQLNSKDEIRKIATGGDRSGTIRGSQQEKVRLRERRNERSAEIDKLKADRDKIRDTVRAYKSTEDTARKVSQLVGDRLVNPEIEIMMRARGRSIALTWVELETELLPALEARTNAAEGAVKRYDEIIKQAEDDLKGFDQARQFTEFLFPDNIDTSNIDPRTSTQFSAAQLTELAEQMDRQTQAALELAKKLREEASEIRKHNARIGKYQSMLAFFGAAAGAANPGGDKATTNITFNKTENRWEIKVMPQSNAPAGQPSPQPPVEMGRQR